MAGLVTRQVQSGFAPVTQAGAIPTIQYSTGSAKALQQFSHDLFSISNQYEDQLDQQAEAESTTKGTVDGATGDFTLQNYGTIRGRAYNKAAVETFAATTDTAAVSKLAELQGKYWNDPDGLQREWTNYQKGAAQVLSQKDPAAGVAFTNRQTIRGIPAIEQAKDMAYKMTRSEADAKLIDSEAATRAEVKASGANLFSDNPDLARASANKIAMVQNDFLGIYAAKDPTTGKPLYTPEEQAAARKSFVDMTMSEAVLANFDANPDKVNTYLKFSSGEAKFNISSNNSQVPIVNKANGTRRLPLAQDWYEKAQAAAAATGEGVGMVIVSAGQAEKGTPGAPRTGSERHDVDANGLGHTADVRLTVNGQEVTPGENPDLYAKFLHNSAAAGFTGIGHYAWGVHIGMGSQAEWGPNTRANTLNPVFGQAIRDGWAGPKLESKPSVTAVPIAQTLSPEAFNRVDAEMRARISFSNSQADRQRENDTRTLTRGQETIAADLYQRLLAPGTPGADGKPLVAPTREEIIQTQKLGFLKPDDSTAILKEMNTVHPQQSDQPTYRDALNRIYAGEDVTQLLRDSGNKLNSSDLAELYGKNKSVVKDNLGAFNNEQKAQYDLLEVRLGQQSLLDPKFDSGRAARKANALDEYRRSVLDPNETRTPNEIMNDVAGRATVNEAQFAQGSLANRTLPRYSVQVPGQYRIDIPASKAALTAAYGAKKIDDQEVVRQIQELQQWDALQQAADKAAAAQKPKVK